MLEKNIRTEDENSYTEIQILVPWGHLAGRWYGDQMEKPILALHGWLDSCGTYAKLAPLIAPYRSVLCIDLPGHGRSTHLPAGISYYNMEFVLMILRIMDVYKWKTVTLLSHSMSGHVSCKFASIYPERVDMVISLDVLIYKYRPPYFTTQYVALVVEKSLEVNERILEPNSSEPPSYTMAECEELYFKGSGQSVNLENCKYILERNITRSKIYPDKYYFSRDGRCKFINDMNVFPELRQEMTKRICDASIPYLVIKGGKSKNLNAKAIDEHLYLLKDNKNFEFYTYPTGTHHLHLNDAKPVAQLIISFLLKHNNAGGQIQLQRSKI